MRVKFTVALLSVLLLLVSGCAKKQPKAGADVPGVINTAYISKDFSAALVVQPRRILESRLVTSLPSEQRAEALKNLQRLFPFDMQQIDEVTLLLVGTMLREDVEGLSKTAWPIAVGGKTAPDPKGPEGITGACIVRFRVPQEPRQVLKTLDEADAKHAESGGKQYYRSTDVLTSAYWFPDDRTLVTAPERLLKKMMMVYGKGSGPLADLLGKVKEEHDVVGAAVMSNRLKQAVESAFAQGGSLSEQFPGFAALPAKIKQGLLIIDVERAPLLTLYLDGKDQEAATSLNGYFVVARDFLVAMFADWRQGWEKKLPVQLSKPMTTLGSDLLAGIEIKQTGNQVGIRVNKPAGWDDLAHTLEPIFAMSQVTAGQDLNRPMPLEKKTPAGSVTKPR